MKTVNARGKPCPQPVTMTKALVDQGERELEVLLDNPVSASNVMRFLKTQSYDVVLKDDEGMLTLSASKKNKDAPVSPQPQASPKTQEPPQQAGPETKKTFSVLITCKNLGQSDAQLGEVLMKSFLGTLPQLNDIPIAVALMNEGVKLALYDSSSCDHLKNLEKKGVSILVCGTCVNHFCLNDQIGVGVVSNMFEIVETLNRADKVITL